MKKILSVLLISLGIFISNSAFCGNKGRSRDMSHRMFNAPQEIAGACITNNLKIETLPNIKINSIMDSLKKCIDINFLTDNIKINYHKDNKGDMEITSLLCLKLANMGTEGGSAYRINENGNIIFNGYKPGRDSTAEAINNANEQKRNKNVFILRR